MRTDDVVYPAGDATLAVDRGALRAKRLARARALLDREGLDALLLRRLENVRYVSDCRTIHSLYFADAFGAFVTPDALTLLGPAGDVPRMEANMPWVDDVRPATGDAVGRYRSLAADHNARRIGVDAPNLDTAAAFEEVVDIGDGLARERAVKFPAEVAIMESAGAVCELAVLAGLDAVTQGVREYEVAAEAVYAAKRAGAEGPSWSPATFSGTNTGRFLRYDSEKRIRRGDLVILGYAFVHAGYNMDVTVTTVVGKPVAAQREMYSAVWDAREAAIDAVAPGVTAREVRDVADDVIADRGFADRSFTAYQPIFHGLGMHVYEPPLAPEPGLDEPNHELRPGHVLVPEPGIYAVDEPAAGGVRIGEPVLVTDDGCERLASVVPDRHDDLYLG